MDPARPQSADWPVFRGETVRLEPDFISYGNRVSVTGLTPTLYWQTNGMGNSWWSQSAEIPIGYTNRVRATFARTNDVGATIYNYFVGLSGSNGSSYRAYGTLVMREGPGDFDPAILPPPSTLGDTFAGMSNLIFSTMQAVSNTLSAGLQVGLQTGNNYADLAAAAASNGAAARLSASGSLWRIEWQASDVAILQSANATLVSSGGLWRMEWTSLVNGSNAAQSAALTNEAAIRAANDALLQSTIAAETNRARQAESQEMTARNNLGISLSNAVSVAMTNWSAALSLVAQACSNYSSAVPGIILAWSSTGSVSYASTSGVSIIALNAGTSTGTVQGIVAGILSTGTAYAISGPQIAMLTLGDALRTIQTDTQAWVSVVNGTATLFVVESIPNTNQLIVLSASQNPSNIPDIFMIKAGDVFYKNDYGWNCVGLLSGWVINPTEQVMHEGFYFQASNVNPTCPTGTFISTVSPAFSVTVDYNGIFVVTNAYPLLPNTGSASGLSGCPSGAAPQSAIDGVISNATVILNLATNMIGGAISNLNVAISNAAVAVISNANVIASASMPKSGGTFSGAVYMGNNLNFGANPFGYLHGTGDGWINLAGPDYGVYNFPPLGPNNSATVISSADAHYSASMTNHQSGVSLSGTWSMTNGTSMADGLLGGTNGVCWIRNGTNYWIMLP